MSLTVISMEKHDVCRPATVDGALIDATSKKILLIQRSTGPFKDKWALPGGYVNFDENVGQAVVREVWEETGLKVKVQSMFGVYSTPDRDPRQTITTVFILKLIGGKIRPSNETSKVEWFPMNKLPKLAFDHKVIISDLRKNLNSGRIWR